MGKHIVYVGTYSEVLGHVPHGKGRGIELFEFDTESGALTALPVQDLVSSHVAIWNSSWVTLHPSRPLLFAVEETEKGSVAAYKIEENGKLVFINKVATNGSYPCHLGVDPSGHFLAASNYGSGNVPLFGINEDGSLTYLSITQHSGKGVNETRQEGPHAHQTHFFGDNVYIVDLGIDAVAQYKLKEGKLSPNPTAAKAVLPPGAGPRHIDFHPTAPVAFVANELDSTLSVCSYDSVTGALNVVATVSFVEHSQTLSMTSLKKSTKPEGFTGVSAPSEIAVSKSGKFVYIANRGHDHIAYESPESFEVIAHVSTQGEHPRHFTFSPDGKHLLVGNQNSDTIVVFRVDEDTGLLHHPQTTNVGTPAVICFSR